ncbi:hypothetical protein BKA69DRAFT_1093601 [Paraphysoderma sedebokerense]|nr:hypothetical protein BKA69DRAFT_1093601 [Paraphysoderma sedebokerense]
MVGVRDGDQIIVELLYAGGAVPSTAPSGSTSTLSTGHGSTQAVASGSSKATTLNQNEEIIELPSGKGYLLRREVPDDNSCLFNSIQYVMDKKSAVQSLREVVASTILSDPIKYNEAILGRPVDEYANWIMKSNSWGGAIELSIFSSVYGVEICSIDIQTGRIDRFGEGMYPKRCLVIYSGIHYDPLSLVITPTSTSPYDITVFDVSPCSSGVNGKDEVLEAAAALAGIMKKKHKYTDLANFTLRCGICKIGLKGQVEATEHAKKTGHMSFVEYS